MPALDLPAESGEMAFIWLLLTHWSVVTITSSSSQTQTQEWTFPKIILALVLIKLGPDFISFSMFFSLVAFIVNFLIVVSASYIGLR